MLHDSGGIISRQYVSSPLLFLFSRLMFSLSLLQTVFSQGKA